jgi:hypothetical protein
MLAHQAREAAPILAREPIAELPEDGAVDTYPPAFAGQSILVTGTDPRPAHEAVWAGVTIQPSDAFK